MPLADSNEAKTRKALIDPALKKAGWDINDARQVGLEIPVDGFDPAEWKKLEADALVSAAALRWLVADLDAW